MSGSVCAFKGLFTLFLISFPNKPSLVFLIFLKEMKFHSFDISLEFSTYFMGLSIAVFVEWKEFMVG